jgi:16S rRNA (cytosine1402-N4)-methyltransferase
VVASGHDGGFVHRPVLLSQAVDALITDPAGCYVDATFGRGGHSAEILRRLASGGLLIAFDRDPEALAAAASLGESRLHMVDACFSALSVSLHALGVSRVAGVLFDLGVSSPQLDDARRGMSFRSDGPLDMRMDPRHGESAADWLNRAEAGQIRRVLRDYGEERFAQQIAAAVVTARQRQPITTTGQLAALVSGAVRTREPGQDPATRTFQAIRIFINQELEELALALPQARDSLQPGGRLVCISFHSLEDRIVKRFIRDCERPFVPPDLPLREDQLPPPSLRALGRAVRPQAGEVAANPRARSAVMRVAERV